MINTLLEHVPIKMEIKGIDEATDTQENGDLAEDDDYMDETDEELVEDDDEEDDEESDIESDALEIEQEATMLISSDEEAELEAQRIRFPDVEISKKVRKDSFTSSRTSSRNSQTSISSSSVHITYEIISKKELPVVENKKQRISPLFKNLANSSTLEICNKENNNTHALLQNKTENNKLENNKFLENKNKQQDEAGKRLDSKTTLDGHKNSENNRHIENLIKSVGQKSRRGSNNSTCSVASTVASDGAETESCGNIYVFNLQQKLIFNCEFCDLKYSDLENFGRHLHEAHKLFNFDEDPEKENAHSNLHKSNRLCNSISKTSANVKKEPLRSLELTAEPPVVLPPSVLAEPLDSCGNVFMINHRKLFLICGYCECKYANLDLFEKHLRQQHRIFEGCCNEVNVVPKVEVKEEVFVTSEAAQKENVTAPSAMVTIPAEIPLDISITPENEDEAADAPEETMETIVEDTKDHSSVPVLEAKPLNSKSVVEQQNSLEGIEISNTKEDKKIDDGNVEKKAPKLRNKRRSTEPISSLALPNKRPKRNTQNNTKVEESTGANEKEKLSEGSSEIRKSMETDKTLKTIETLDAKTSIIEQSKSGTIPEITATKHNNKLTKPTKSEKRETRKSTKAPQSKKTKSRKTKETRKVARALNSKNTKKETIATKETRKSTKYPENKKLKEDKPEIEIESKETKLKCSLCPKEYTSKDILENHERTHTAEKNFVCEVCHKSFKDKANLSSHRLYHFQKKYKCEVCGKKFSRSSDCKIHMSTHSSEKRFKCDICLRGYASKQNLKTHIDREHNSCGKESDSNAVEAFYCNDKGKNRFQCDRCLRDYASKQGLSAHIKKEHKHDKESSESEVESDRKENLINTKMENERTSLLSPLTASLSELMHVSTLPEDAVTVDDINQKAQAAESPEDNNITDDLNDDPVNDIMEQLQKEVEVKEVVNKEVNTVTYTIKTAPKRWKVVKQFFCDICPSSFQKRIRLVEHKRIHTGEKPFTCDECGRQFRLRMQLREHKLRHSKEKKFICEICQLGCCTKHDLNQHMRHHTNDRRFQCSNCPKAFVRSSDLKIHVRVHTGEKPYVCEICHKCFRANQNLSVHRKSHMGEASKTYKCERCDKKFLRKIDRKVHMRSHTGEKPYKCEICQRGYSSKFNVRAHIERDHISANSKDNPPKVKKKPGRKTGVLRYELAMHKKLIEELQNQLYQQIKRDEKIITSDDEILQHTEQESALRSTSPLSTTSNIDPIQSAYDLLNKLKSSATTSKPLTVISSPPPMEELPANSVGKAERESANILPLTITKKLEQALPSCSPSSTTTSSITTPSPPKTTATKVVSQKTSLGIQQVSVTVSMQVENVTANPVTSEKENTAVLTTNSSAASSAKKERKITSYFTVVGQKAEA